MNFSIKSKSVLLVDKATVWRKLTDRRFISTHFPEMTKSDLHISDHHAASTHQRPSELLPSWAINGKSIAWDANAGIEFALPNENVSIESIYINISNRGGHTELMMEVEGDFRVGVGYWQARKDVDEFIKEKLSALREAIGLTETSELSIAA